MINYALLEWAKKFRGSKCCWGQSVLVMRTIFRMCGNESQPGLQLVEKLAMPRALLPLNAITGCDSTSFICKHSKKTVKPHFFFPLPWTSLNVLRADTIAPADRFVCPLCMTDKETNWTMLAPCYLSNSINQRSYALFATRLSNTWEIPLTNNGLAPSTDSKSGTSEPWGDRMKAEDEDLLISIFMTLDSILEACLEWVLTWFATGYTVITVSCMSCALGCVDILGPTLTAASTGTRLCEKLKRC